MATPTQIPDVILHLANKRLEMVLKINDSKTCMHILYILQYNSPSCICDPLSRKEPELKSISSLLRCWYGLKVHEMQLHNV